MCSCWCQVMHGRRVWYPGVPAGGHQGKYHSLHGCEGFERCENRLWSQRGFTRMCFRLQSSHLSSALCVQRKHQEIRAMRSQLKKIEDLGAAMEEALILDNKYTEHSTVGLAQQWDQLDQLGMRMQHNLEQQIQARYTVQQQLCATEQMWISNTVVLVAALGSRFSFFLFQKYHRSDRGGSEGIQYDVQVSVSLLTLPGLVCLSQILIFTLFFADTLTRRSLAV